MEKGIKSQHLGHKKKFQSPLGGKRPHKTSIFPKFSVNIKEPDRLGTKTKHGAKGSKLKFQMGGDSTDPLNLNSLIDRDPSEVTPQCSPFVDRMKELSPQVVIARDVTDPLNLKCDLYQDMKGIVVVTPGRKKRKRKRNDSDCLEDEQENKHKKETSGKKEDVVSPKVKKKKMQKAGKDVKEAKEVKMKEKKKEKSKVEKETDDADGNKIDEASLAEQKVSKAVLESSKKEISVEEVKLSSKVKEDSIKEVQKVKPSLTKESQLSRVTTGTKEAGMGSRKHQKTFLYGNYNRYYGYRNPIVHDDPRLKLFHPEWFQDKTVLDIGCNIGNVTLEIARDFSPKHILGIDIDSSLIRAANKYLRYAIQENISKKPPTQPSEFPISFMVCRGPIVSRTSPTEGRTGFPYNVQFKEVSVHMQ